MKHTEDASGLFDLDQLTLDRDWCNQAKLTYEYGLKTVEARSSLDRAKRQRDLAVAEVDLLVRKNPGSFGLEKTTEASIASVVLLDERVRNAEAKVLLRQQQLGVLQAIMHALNDRKSALENLSNLWSQSYFSEPRAKPAAREQMETMQKRSTRHKGQRT